MEKNKQFLYNKLVVGGKNATQNEQRREYLNRFFNFFLFCDIF